MTDFAALAFAVAAFAWSRTDTGRRWTLGLWAELRREMAWRRIARTHRPRRDP